ncbi:MAG: ferredoxin [Ilumatobacteraceae bacterium]
MKVWIDQDCCTGAGLCVDRCPELFIVLEDGIGYVHDGALAITGAEQPSVVVPRRYEHAAIDAVERCPGECIYLEPDDATQRATATTGADRILDATDIVDAELVEK